LITEEWLFWLVGFIVMVVAVQTLCDHSNPKRVGSGVFWGLLGSAFCYSSFVVKRQAPPEPLGGMVLVMACLGGCGLTGRGKPVSTSPEQRAASAAHHGNWLFVPALTIPLVAMIVATLGRHIRIDGNPAFDPGGVTIIGLGLAATVALVVGLIVFRERRLSIPFREGRELFEAIGWTALLPQMLATLGSIFVNAGVGRELAVVTGDLLPPGRRFLAVTVYCLGMAVLSIVMGNAYAAFPLMTATVGWPLLVEQYHGTPAAVLAMGMFAGFCGTLVSPMAANFNLVPAALLELKDRHGPIKAQMTTAMSLLACNIAIMALFSF
jgi:uncharacterized membrane protein